MNTQLVNTTLLVGGALLAPLGFAQTQLHEVVVTTSRIEIPVRQVGAAVSVVDGEEIELRGYNSMTELLRTQPGVTVSNSGGPGKNSSLNIRGEEGFRTLVMVDGVDISDPTALRGGPQIQYLTAGADIERVEVLRGPQGFIYGADAGGVVNIITRTAQGFASKVSAEAGDYDSANVQGFIAAGGERASGFFSANHYSTGGFNARTSDLTNEPDGYDNTTLHGKARLDIANGWSSQLVVRSTSVNSDFDGCDNDCVWDFEQNIGKASLAYESENFVQSLAIGKVLTDRTSIVRGVADFVSDGSRTKFEYFGSSAVNSVVSLLWGGDAVQEEVRADLDGAGDGAGDSDSRDQYGAFTEAQVNLREAFYLSAGLRYDDNEDFGEHLSSRISSAYIDELESGINIKYRASWGTGFRAPSLREIFYNRREIPNAPTPTSAPNLKEETSQGVDVGVEFYFPNDYVLQLGLFDQKVDNEIQYDRDSQMYQQGEGTSHSRGAELAFELPVVSFVTVEGNYTYTDALTRDEDLRHRRPKHSANIAARAHLFDSRLSTIINLRVARDAVHSVSSQTPLDDYEVLDLSANYKPLAMVTLFGRIENVLDEQYQEVIGYNTAGRALYAGIKYSF